MIQQCGYFWKCQAQSAAGIAAGTEVKWHEIGPCTAEHRGHSSLRASQILEPCFSFARKFQPSRLIHRLIGPWLELSTLTDSPEIFGSTAHSRAESHPSTHTALARLAQHSHHVICQPGDPPWRPESRPGARCHPLRRQPWSFGDPPARSREHADGGSKRGRRLFAQHEPAEADQER
jgi:hypothetical protein